MEAILRSALLDWLRADPALAVLNMIAEESPLAATPPWLGIAASASADWSTKDRVGREVRIAFELTVRGDDPDAANALARAVEARIAALPPDLPGLRIASNVFLRARSERRTRNLRGLLIEHRFRLIATE